MRCVFWKEQKGSLVSIFVSAFTAHVLFHLNASDKKKGGGGRLSKEERKQSSEKGTKPNLQGVYGA